MYVCNLCLWTETFFSQLRLLPTHLLLVEESEHCNSLTATRREWALQVLPGPDRLMVRYFTDAFEVTSSCFISSTAPVFHYSSWWVVGSCVTVGVLRSWCLVAGHWKTHAIWWWHLSKSVFGRSSEEAIITGAGNSSYIILTAGTIHAWIRETFIHI